MTVYGCGATQFMALGVETMRVAKFDVEKYVLPAHVGVQYSSLPAVVFFPAKDKQVPYKYFTGRGKAQYLMWWAQEHASYSFELPEDPHLTPEQRVMKKVQLRQRAEQKVTEAEAAEVAGDWAKAAADYEAAGQVPISDAELTAKLVAGLARAKTHLDAAVALGGGADNKEL